MTEPQEHSRLTATPGHLPVARTEQGHDVFQPARTPVPSQREVRQAAAAVLTAAMRFIPPSLPDYKQAQDAAVQYQEMALKAMERNDTAGVLSAMRSLQRLPADIERTWRR